MTEAAGHTAKLMLGAGKAFHGEAVVAIAKALLQAGIRSEEHTSELQSH